MRYIVKPLAGYDELINDELQAWVKRGMCRCELVPDPDSETAHHHHKHHKKYLDDGRSLCEQMKTIMIKESLLEINTDQARKIAKSLGRKSNSAVYNAFKILKEEGVVSPIRTIGKGNTDYQVHQMKLSEIKS